MQNPTPRVNHCEAREKGRRVKLWQLNCAIAKFLCYQSFTGFAYWHDATYRTKRENSINLICLTAQKQDKSVSEFLLAGWLLRGKPFCPFRCARTCPNGRVYTHTVKEVFPREDLSKMSPHFARAHCTGVGGSTRIRFHPVVAV